MNRARQVSAPSRRRLFTQDVLSELVQENVMDEDSEEEPQADDLDSSIDANSPSLSSSESENTESDLNTSTTSISVLSERSGTSSSMSRSASENGSSVSGPPSQVTLDMLYMQNKKLQEQLRKQSEELEAIRKNVAVGTAKSRGKLVVVPYECSQAVREVYGKLYPDGNGGFDLEMMKTSAENEAVVSRLCREVRSLHGRHKWGLDQITKASKTYFSSLRDRQRRQQNGTYQQHRDAARKRSRKFRKLQRRQSALLTLPDSGLQGASRDEAREVLSVDFMSSEDSMSEEEAGGNPNVRKTRRLRKLPWERSRLTSLKNKLDVHFAKTAPPAVSRLLPEFVVSRIPSQRPALNGPSWAVRSQPSV